MSNEVELKCRFLFIIFFLFLFTTPSYAEYNIKLSHIIPNQEDKQKFLNKLDCHKENFHKKQNNKFLQKIESFRFKSYKSFDSMNLEEQIECEKRFGSALLKLTNFKDSQYVADFRIGEPAQVHKIMFDTGSSNFWVTSHKCEDPGCKIHKGYNGSKSRYYKPLNKKITVHFGSGSVEGSLAKDKVEFGPLTIYDQEFGMMEKQSGEIFKTLKFSGILGLSFPKLSQHKFVPFFDNVIKEGLLKNNYFSFYLTKKEEHVDSQLILGEPSKIFYKGN